MPTLITRPVTVAAAGNKPKTIEEFIGRASSGHDNISVAIVDLRTIVPLDWDTIAAYTRKTNRVIVAHEDQMTAGFGGHIAARIGEELFDELDAPVTRVASLDCPVAYAPVLEEAILPGSADMLKAIRSVAAY